MEIYKFQGFFLFFSGAGCRIVNETNLEKAQKYRFYLSFLGKSYRPASHFTLSKCSLADKSIWTELFGFYKLVVLIWLEVDPNSEIVDTTWGYFCPSCVGRWFWNLVGRGQGSGTKSVGMDETKTWFPIIRELGDPGDWSRVLLVVYLFRNGCKTKPTAHILYLWHSPEVTLALTSCLAWLIYSPWELKHTNMHTWNNYRLALLRKVLVRGEISQTRGSAKIPWPLLIPETIQRGSSGLDILAIKGKK